MPPLFIAERFLYIKWKLNTIEIELKIRRHFILYYVNINKQKKYILQGIKVMVFNATFNNISAILWRSVLLVEETRVPWENHRTAETHWLYNIMLYQVHLVWAGFKFATLVVIQCRYFLYYMWLTDILPSGS